MESYQTVPGAAAANESDEQEALFKPFDWMSDDLRKADRLASNTLELGHTVNDLARGVELVLQILEHDSMVKDGAPEERPLFNDFHHGVLMRLAIASVGTIQASVDQHAKWVEKYHIPARAT
jgi:hypothetical protein